MEEVWDLEGGAARVVDEEAMGAEAEGSDAEEVSAVVGAADAGGAGGRDSFCGENAGRSGSAEVGENEEVSRGSSIDIASSSVEHFRANKPICIKSCVSAHRSRACSSRRGRTPAGSGRRKW